MNASRTCRTRLSAGITSVLILIGICGCRAGIHPDLDRLYAASPETGTDAPQARPPVIVIPGILGSRLREHASGREVWPGSPLHALTGDRAQLALPIDADTLTVQDDGLEAYDIFDALLGEDYYGRLLQTLERHGRYQRTAIGTPVHDAQPRYYVFAYDWRQDNVVTARRLDDFIESIRRDHANPGLRVDVIAHSMGGLILRYYLRYGRNDVLDGNALTINFSGTRKVRRAILIGTPNLGSASSLHSFITGHRIGLRRFLPEDLASAPSTYQLFPHPLTDWLITPDGRTLDRDVFNVEIWRRFQWSVFDPAARKRLIRRHHGDVQAADAQLQLLQRFFAQQLERARRFVWALTRQLDDSPERLIVFGSDCQLTPSRLLVEEIDDESVIRLTPGSVRTQVAGIDLGRRMEAPGDGLVTRASLLGRQHTDPRHRRHPYAFFPLSYSMLFCESHETLTSNPSFQNNLLNLLLDEDPRYDQQSDTAKADITPP